jgi:hypothetical protein
VLERAEEGEEVGPLAGAELDGEALVVEVHDVLERGGRAIVEVRRAASAP